RSRGCIDRRDFAEQYVGVFLAAKEPADRRGDVGRREHRRRDLVEQRLEDVMIRAVDDGDIDGRVLERARGVEAAEAAADDDDAWAGDHYCPQFFSSLMVLWLQILSDFSDLVVQAAPRL